MSPQYQEVGHRWSNLTYDNKRKDGDDGQEAGPRP